MTCSLCHQPGGELINAGGDLGLVHRRCFVAWDVDQEQREVERAGWEAYMGGNRAPPPRKRDRTKPPATSRPLVHVARVTGEPLHVARARDRLAARGYFVEAA